MKNVKFIWSLAFVKWQEKSSTVSQAFSWFYGWSVKTQALLLFLYIYSENKGELLFSHAFGIKILSVFQKGTKLSPRLHSDGESRTLVCSVLRECFWLYGMKSSVKQTLNLRHFPRHVFSLSSLSFLQLIQCLFVSHHHHHHHHHHKVRLEPWSKERLILLGILSVFLHLFFNYSLPVRCISYIYESLRYKLRPICLTEEAADVVIILGLLS